MNMLGLDAFLSIHSTFAGSLGKQSFDEIIRNAKVGTNSPKLQIRVQIYIGQSKLNN